MSSLTLLSSFTKTQGNLNFVKMEQMLERGENKYFKVAIIKLFQIVGNLNIEKKDEKKRHQFENRSCHGVCGELHSRTWQRSSAEVRGSSPMHSAEKADGKQQDPAP